MPRQWQSADKQRLRGIPKQGASDIRRNLVLAGQSLLTMIERRQEPSQDRLLIWAQRLLRRKQRNVAAVAVAAKLARIAWADLAKGEAYRPRASSPPASPPRHDLHPDRLHTGAVLAALKTAARRLRRWPAASLDRGSGRRLSEFRSGRRNGSRSNKETVCLPTRET